ncbi:porin family protein [Bradyrhizobium ontarionense]|uniref:Porin family protein n=1 Tax=Bradyrhizobium ontarionense TaxID=2898149 RepID=A0ABY3REY8_9BRAD|nr:outer membrane protein [Bradyrhizobium sp. A19]UFZ05878.1 porin family protein [Bradyrhizobium sp. A19]
MKKILLATVALAALAAPAAAADLAARPYTKAPVAAPLPTWAGFYIGAMGGYASQDNNSFAGFVAPFSLSQKGGFAGGTIGYNWQQGPVVFGVEADAAWADINGSVTAGGATFSSKIEDMGTVRGRLGYTFGPAMLYATGGYAWMENKATLSGFGATDFGRQFHNGWTLGAGAEYMFVPNWSVKAEYLYKSFGSENYAAGGLLPSGTINLHTVQVGVNYHF